MCIRDIFVSDFYCIQNFIKHIVYYIDSLYLNLLHIIYIYYISIFHPDKRDFDVNLGMITIIFRRNICCDPSLELPLGSSQDGSQRIFFMAK